MENKWLDINEVIIHYLDASATGEEKLFLLEWLKQSEDHRNEFSEVRDLWLLSNTISGNELETEIALGRLKQTILKQTNRIAMPPSPKEVSFFRRRVHTLVKLVALFLLLLSVGTTFYYLGGVSGNEQTVVMNRLLTANGSKGRFVLPDSTIVWLNSNTLLEYPETFAASSREVRLEGEAYFEVRRNEKVPFHVHAGEIDVEVLGTRFLVENHQCRSVVETVLVEGSVKVAGSEMSHSVILTPGQLLSYHKEKGGADVQAIDTSDYISWMQDELTFDNAKLTNIIVNLKRWYGVEIECPPTFAETVSMSFSVRSGEKLDEILKAMSLVAPIRYHWEENVLHITSLKK